MASQPSFSHTRHSSRKLFAWASVQLGEFAAHVYISVQHSKPLNCLCCSCGLSACSKDPLLLPCSKKTDVMRRVVAARQAAGEQDLSMTDARLAELQQRSRNSRGIAASAASPAQVRAS